MNKTFLLIYITAFFLTPSYGVAETPTASCPTSKEFATLAAPSMADRFWIASRIYASVTARFAHWSSLDPSYDFDEHYQDYLKSLSTISTRLDFDKKTAKLFASLHNTHTSFSDQLVHCYPGLPFRVGFIEGKWIVTRSWIKSVPVGVEVSAINHDVFSTWADQQVAFISDSSLRDQRQDLTSMKYGVWLWPRKFTLTFHFPGKKDVSVDVDRNLSDSSEKNPPIKGRYVAVKGVSVSQISPGIERITVSDFSHPENEKKMVQAVRDHQDVPALLFDVRGNGGGSAPNDLIQSLLEKPTKDEIGMSPQHIAVNDAYSDVALSDVLSYSHTWFRFGGDVIKPKTLYHGKVFVLTDDGCASACEDFLMIMKSSKRAVIMGEESVGGYGLRSDVFFPKQNMRFAVGVINVLWPDGTEAEGKGIIPDVSIPLTQEELLAGKDAVLEKSIKYINNVMKKDHHG